MEMFEAAEEMKKPVDEVIQRFGADFNSLSHLEELEILGLSYSPIDMPYLEEVIKIAGKDIKVKLGWHQASDKDNAESFASQAGLTNWELVFF